MGRSEPSASSRTVTPSAYGLEVGEHQFEYEGGGSGEVPPTPLVDRYRTCTSEDLAAMYAELGGGARALEAQRLAILGVLDERDAWTVDGARDTIGWVSATDAARRVNAKGVVEVARKLKDLPAIAAVAAAGGVSFDQLRALCALATPDTDAHWAAQGPSLEPGQLAAAAAKATRVTREAVQQQEARRHLTWWKARGGGVRGSFYLPDVDADTLANGIDRLASTDKPAPGDPWDPVHVRRADALVELAAMSLADTVIGDPAHLYVHAAAGAFGEENDGWATLADGTSIARETLERLGCDATTQLVLHDPSGAFVALGAVTHAVPRRIRRLLAARDRCCRFPGCETSRGLHAHHLRFWSKRGETEVWNLALLCHRHHKAVHEGGWTITGNPDTPDGLTYVSPTGRAVTTPPEACSQRVSERLIPDPPPSPRERAAKRRKDCRARPGALTGWRRVDITKEWASLRAAEQRLRDAILRPTTDHGS